MTFGQENLPFICFFLFEQQKVELFAFQQGKVLLEQFFKCKLYFKNSSKLNKFTVVQVKIFLVTRISRNKSVFLFGLQSKS